MNKRSAVAVAGGVAGALVSGLAGYSVRMQHQPARPVADPAKPIVKTQVRTVTIHKKAKPRPAPVSAVAAPQNAAPVTTVVVHRAPTVVPMTRAAPAAPLHHTGGSRVAGGGDPEHESDGGGDGGGD
jgi:hypothetical protein